MKNGYIIIQDIKNEYINDTGIYVPDEKVNRFAKVLKEGDVIVKPIGRTTPIKINGEIYDCLREGFVFAKIITDNENGED